MAKLKSAKYPALSGPVVAAAMLLLVPLARADAAAVRIANFTFDPPQLTVKAGTTVSWRNEDDIPHAIAAADRKFKSKVLDTDDHFSFTFANPGTYSYFCSIHPHMTGTVVVQASTAAN